jgi:multidrug efflux pump subunit AcrB
MNISAPFIQRPVATSLLTVGLFLSGALAYPFLPVASLPEVEYPTITVYANLPGASPETMATAVATPLERMFGRIAGITQMTSNSQLGSTNVTMQFDLDRNVDAAARDVQAAINVARGQLPANLPTNPNWRKVNPAESDIMNLAVTSDTGRFKSHVWLTPAVNELEKRIKGFKERSAIFATNLRNREFAFPGHSLFDPCFESSLECSFYRDTTLWKGLSHRLTPPEMQIPCIFFC